MAAPEKLHALLEIVRLTVMREGVSVSELSETLHISAKKIRETIALLSVIGVPPYRPDQLLDRMIEVQTGDLFGVRPLLLELQLLDQIFVRHLRETPSLIRIKVDIITP